MMKMHALAVPCLLAPFAGAQTISGSLVALDPITAILVDTSAANAVVAQQSHAAGPVTSANLQVSHAHYTCSIAALGSGARLQAFTTAMPHLQGPLQSRTHADLVLTFTGSPGAVASIELLLQHAGDYADATGFTVDLGNDGSVEIDSSGGLGATIASPEHHRFWTWDFASGPLQIRIRTDEIGIFGAQAYWLTLTALPWVPGARPAGPGCTFDARLTSPTFLDSESTNYQLAALAPTNAQQLSVLRAAGLGQFHAFLVDVSPTTVTVQLPLPYPSASVPLLGGLFLFQGQVTATTSLGGPLTLPRTWELGVPLLPPGMTFYVQHASATLASPYLLGTSNVVRFDT